jgi:hypothetical protein
MAVGGGGGERRRTKTTTAAAIAAAMVEEVVVAMAATAATVAEAMAAETDWQNSGAGITLPARGLAELFSSSAVVSVFGSGGK